MCAKLLQSCLFVTLWTIACQAALSMAFSKPEYWSGPPFLPPGDLPNTGIEPEFLTSHALAARFFTTSATWEGQNIFEIQQIPSFASVKTQFYNTRG